MVLTLHVLFQGVQDLFRDLMGCVRVCVCVCVCVCAAGKWHVRIVCAMLEGEGGREGGRLLSGSFALFQTEVAGCLSAEANMAVVA